MKDSIEISRKTKSTAYRFIKSLMNDGVEGDAIHNLVTAISDNVNPEVGGTILTDLIRNSKDENGDLKYEQHWFGPIGVEYYHWILKSWADFCKDIELRGTIKLGDLDDWKKWNLQNGNKFSKEEVEKKSKKGSPQLCIFEWYADSVTTVDARKHLNDLYDRVYKRVQKEDEDDDL